MHRPWIYLINPFEVLTKDNYTLALGISSYHLAVLKAASANPFFDALYTDYLPVHEALTKAYSTWHSLAGTQAGGTLRLKQLIKTLSATKISDWDIAIQNIYRKGTPQYVALLPHRRKPFQSGQRFDRVEAVAILSLAIGSDAALAAVKADVDTFYTQLNTVYTSQKNKKSGTKQGSAAVEKARKDMCQFQYANLGALIQYYAAEPHRAGAFFKLGLIRHHHQVIFNRHVEPLATIFIVEHTFAPASKIKVHNKGNCPLEFYLNKYKDNHSATLKVTVPALTKLIIDVKDLGGPEGSFLHVNNPDEGLTGLFRLDIRG